MCGAVLGVTGDFCVLSDAFALVSSHLPSKEPRILEPSPPEAVGEVCGAVLGVTGGLADTARDGRGASVDATS